VDITDCTKVQDKMWQGKFGEDRRWPVETLAVARQSKIPHTVSVETIE